MKYLQNMIQRPRPFRFRALAQISFFIILSLFLHACTSSESTILYRLPYTNGTDLNVWQDHLTHNPLNKVDMKGINNMEPYPIVAAQTGVVRIIVDDLTQNCCGGTCGNNYVWLEHETGEWSKYSHLATNSIRGDAGLTEGDVVIAGTFIGFESNIGRACGTGNGVHLHFESGIPNDPANPLVTTDNIGSLNGTNQIPRFCGVDGEILSKGSNETATICNGLLSCIQSRESPSTEGNCEEGLAEIVCVQEIDNPFDSTYVNGQHFTSGSLKIDLDWCPNAECDEDVEFGRAVHVVVHSQDPSVDPIFFIANCQNRRVLETVHNVKSVVIQEVPNLLDENVVCNGNEFQSTFARWEICEVPESFAP